MPDLGINTYVPNVVLFRVANFVFGRVRVFAKKFGRVSGGFRVPEPEPKPARNPNPKPARTETRPFFFLGFTNYLVNFLIFSVYSKFISVLFVSSLNIYSLGQVKC